MQVVLLLVERNQPLQLRHAGVDPRCRAPAGDGESRVWILPDQMIEHTASDDGITNAIGGDE
jgi:hypothetical protein